MLAICTWLWGNKYGTQDVYKLKRAIDRNIGQVYRFIMITEETRPISKQTLSGVERYPIIDLKLLSTPGCFARLRMFDPKWQAQLKIDDRLVCLDLDVVITRKIDALFNRPENFVILAGANSVNPCPFNGSVMMLRPGYHEYVFSDWTFMKSVALPYHDFPDDQGWIAHKIPNAATWKAGTESGIYAFKKPGWPHGLNLPMDAKMVVFPGKRQPSQYIGLSWVEQHWAQ